MGDLTFLPWARAGASAAVNATGTAMGPNRPPVQVQLTVTQTLDGGTPATLTPDPGVSMELLGPGDVTGLAPGQVIRTEPADGATGVDAHGVPRRRVRRGHAPVAVHPCAGERALARRGRAAGGQPPAAALDLPGYRPRRARDHAGHRRRDADDRRPRRRPPGNCPTWPKRGRGRTSSTPGTCPPTRDRPSPTSPAPPEARCPGCCRRAILPRTPGTTPAWSPRSWPGGSPGSAAALTRRRDRQPRVGRQPSRGAELTLPVYFSFTFTTGTGGDFQSLAQLLVHPPQVSAAPDSGLGPRTLTVSLPFGQQPTSTVTLPMPGMLGPVLASPLPPPPLPAAVEQAVQDAITPDPADALPELLATAYGAVQAGISAAAIIVELGDAAVVVPGAEHRPAAAGRGGTGAAGGSGAARAARRRRLGPGQ